MALAHSQRSMAPGEPLYREVVASDEDAEAAVIGDRGARPLLSCRHGAWRFLVVGVGLSLVAYACGLMGGSGGDVKQQPALASMQSLVGKSDWSMLEMGVGVWELFGGMNPLEFECPLPDFLESDDAGRRLLEEPSTASTEECCQAYDSQHWPYQFPECINASSCPSCWHASAASQRPGRLLQFPAAKYAAVAWAAAASVASHRDSADGNWFTDRAKGMYRDFVGDEPDGVSSDAMKDGAMSAKMSAGFDSFNVNICPHVLDWTVKALDDEKGNIHVRVYEAASAKLAVVAFRGTQVTSMKNWYVDADVGTVELPLGEGGNITLVHEGFMEEAKRVSPRVKDWLNGYMLGLVAGVPDDWTVVFSGHSLGGALALLVSTLAEIEEWSRRPDGIVVYGAPRVADATLDRWWHERGLCAKLLRVNVYNDVIHWMPFAAIGNLADVIASFIGCLDSAASCLDSGSNSTVFSERWTHVCDESELIVASPTRGVNVLHEDFSSIGGVLSHYISNCDFGYGFGVLNSSIVQLDTYCGISDALCAQSGAPS